MGVRNPNTCLNPDRAREGIGGAFPVMLTSLAVLCARDAGRAAQTSLAEYLKRPQRVGLTPITYGDENLTNRLNTLFCCYVLSEARFSATADEVGTQFYRQPLWPFCTDVCCRC